MSRGFLKTIGGVKRLRMVRAGFDANNLNLAQNNVIFDSSDLAAFSVYLSGSHLIGGDMTDSIQVTWPSLGYIPHAQVFFSKSHRQSLVPVTLSQTAAAKVSHTALLINAVGLNYPVDMHYVIYRGQ